MTAGIHGRDERPIRLGKPAISLKPNRTDRPPVPPVGQRRSSSAATFPSRTFLSGFSAGGCKGVKMMNDSELLRRYAEDASEEAFAELVRRHLHLVYAAAWRQTGDAHRAEDV